MKGVVLAGGRGTRLRPITKVVNKHVLPVYDLPMIYYPVKTLTDAGIDDILVISNADHLGKYIELLEGEFEANFQYKVQSEPKGIAHAVSLAEAFVEDKFVVILGDNIVLDNISEKIKSFSEDSGAKIFITPVDDPSSYGIVSIDDDTVTKIEEKPTDPESNHAATGVYVYTSDVFEVISDLKPSDRGEYEITDVNQHYLEQGSLKYEVLEGEWFDAGTPEGLFKASKKVREQK